MSDKIFKVESYGKTYTLFGQKIKFSAAEERCYDLDHFLTFGICRNNFDKIGPWIDSYESKQNIIALFDNFLDFAKERLTELFKPLYNSLADCEIYDISEEMYCRRCLVTENCEAALKLLVKQYMTPEGRRIQEDQDIFNFDSRSFVLSQSFAKDVRASFLRHIALLNKHFPKYVDVSFLSSKDKMDRADALFENAKKLAGKRKELLVQAVRLCPYHGVFIPYIFVNYGQERKNAVEIAERFNIPLSDAFEDVLKEMYKSASKETEEDLAALRSKLLAFMREYNMTSSRALVRVDKKIQEKKGKIWRADLKKLCKNVNTFSKISQCEELQEAVNKHDALNELKAPFLAEIEEQKENIWRAELKKLCKDVKTFSKISQCDELQEAVKKHDALDKLKAPFLAEIEKQKEVIWPADLLKICEGAEILKRLYHYREEGNVSDHESKKKIFSSIIADYNVSEEESLTKILSSIAAYQCPDRCKAEFTSLIYNLIDQLWVNKCSEIGQSDEAQCRELLSKINASAVSEKVKKNVIDLVRNRLNEIADEVCKNRYLNTDLKDRAAVDSAISFITKQKDVAQPYLDALRACRDNPNIVEQAGKFLSGQIGRGWWWEFWMWLCGLCTVIFSYTAVLLLIVKIVNSIDGAPIWLTCVANIFPKWVTFSGLLPVWLSIGLFVAAAVSGLMIMPICGGMAEDRWRAGREAAILLTIAGKCSHRALFDNPEQANRFRYNKKIPEELEMSKSVIFVGSFLYAGLFIIIILLCLLGLYLVCLLFKYLISLF